MYNVEFTWTWAAKEKQLVQDVFVFIFKMFVCLSASRVSPFHKGQRDKTRQEEGGNVKNANLRCKNGCANECDISWPSANYYNPRQLVVSIPRLYASSCHLLDKINAMGTFFFIRDNFFDWQVVNSDTWLDSWWIILDSYLL